MTVAEQTLIVIIIDIIVIIIGARWIWAHVPKGY